MPKQYTPSEKVEVLAFFERERGKNTPNVEIIKECGVSPATLYRWIAETNVRTNKWRYAGIKKLEQAIHFLASGQDHSKWPFLEAIFTFACWLHWPNRPDYIPIGVTSMLCLYAEKTEGKAFACELPGDALVAISRNLLLHPLAMIASGFDSDLPVFRSDELDEQPFTMRDLIGEGCNCLLAMAEHKEKWLSPSINKIIYLMRQQLFRYCWNVSRNSLEKAWEENLAAAPFFYVEIYHSSLDWALYPDSHLFVEQVDSLLSDTAAFPTYFRRCKAATLALKAALPVRRAMQFSYPRFRNGLREETLTPAPLSDAIKTALKGYRSADR